MNEAAKYILKEISKEIESKHNCKVIDIRFAELLSLCIMAKIQFNEDFHYQPEWLKHYSISAICFSEKTINIVRMVDLFDCVNENSRKN